MIVMKLLLSFVSLFVVVLGGNHTGDHCVLNPNEIAGECRLLNNCKEPPPDLKEKGAICGYHDQQPIVCCPQKEETRDAGSLRETGKTSKQKCKEYSQYVYEEQPSPILLPGAEPIQKDECGHKAVPLIVGGENVTRKEFPHMAAVGFEREGRVQWLCGGSLISEQFVVTAAHCLYGQFGPAQYVRVGVTLLSATEHLQEFKIIERVKHPDYKASSFYNDLALLKLDKPVKMNSFARPACLYTSDTISTQKVIATGFGLEKFDDFQGSKYLLKVVLNLLPHQDCFDQYKKHGTQRKLAQGIVENSQFCTGSRENKDTCRGDSGGPLQIYHTSDDTYCMYDVVGVTSFGTEGCGGVASVHTRLSNYLKWIEDKVWPSEL